MTKQIQNSHIVTMCVLSAVYITYAAMTISSIQALGITELLTQLLAPLRSIVGSSINVIISISSNIVVELMGLMSVAGEQVVTVILPIIGEYIGKLWGIVYPYITLTGSVAWLARFFPNPDSEDSFLSKIGLSKLLSELSPKGENIITFTTGILESVNNGYNMVMRVTSLGGSKADNLQHKIENTILTGKKTVTKGFLNMKNYVESVHYRLYYMIYDRLYKFMKVAPYTPEDYQNWIVGTMRVFTGIKYTTARESALINRKKTKRLQRSTIKPVNPFEGSIRGVARPSAKPKRGGPSRPISRYTLKSKTPRLRRTLSTAKAINPNNIKPNGYRSEGKKK